MAVVVTSYNRARSRHSYWFSQSGYRYCGVGIQDAPETRQQVEALGRGFHYITQNLMKQDGLQALVDEAISVMGRIDILVNNAGIIRREDLLEFGKKDWDDV